LAVLNDLTVFGSVFLQLSPIGGIAMVTSTGKRASGTVSLGAAKRNGKTAELLPFRDSGLCEQFAEYCQLLHHETSFKALDARWKAKRDSAIEFIPNESFSEPFAEADILGDHLLGMAGETSRVSRSSRLAELPTYLARLCEARLLQGDEESKMFRRMNYLLFLAEEVRKKMDANNPSELGLVRIQGLVSAAHWHRDYIVKANMRLVISIVKKFVNLNNNFDDLLSDGIMALIRAVEKFDFNRGFRFSTYATQVVRRNAYRNVMTKQRERSRIGLILDEANVDIESRETVSGVSLERWNVLTGKLGQLLNQLDRREKLIVRARFSLGGHRSVQTLQRIADALGVSKERVRQIEKRALEKLRSLASHEELPEFAVE
jgi:RNA polymerase primary sigma factor